MSARLRMKALDRKLLRDLRAMWSQALTIALVVASGVAGFLTSLSAVDSLARAHDHFYETNRFADVFAAVRRAPMAALDAIAALPGVADVQPTVEQLVRIELADTTDPITGQLVGLDRRDPARLNRLTLRAGRWPHDAGADAAGDGALRALVSAGFATARGLAPGSRVAALINGKRRVLQIEGIAVSPEFIFAGLGGMPDLRSFGIFWVDREALAAATDMGGAFNRVALRLAPGASERDVVERLSAQLARWGGREAHGRDDQSSHRMLEMEIQEQRVIGTVLPVIFLAVAAFLLDVVVSRLVATQREQIAALKALGYPNATIAVHYLQLVLAIVAAGVLLGLAAGSRLGEMFTGLYAEFYFFPSFEHRLAVPLVAVACGVSAAVGVAGTLKALASVVRLAPAEAMRPPAPGRYRPTLLERWGVRRIGHALRMILRQMERRPLRQAIAIGGIAAAVAIVVLGNFVRDAMDHIVETQFHLAMRADVIVSTTEPADAAPLVAALARLPGVIETEPGRDVAVRFVAGHRSERGAIQGHEAAPRLRRIIDVEGVRQAPREDGLVLTDRLAAKLGVAAGDTVRVETLAGEERTLVLPVAATVREMMGLNAYLERGALNRALGEGDLATQVSLAVERGREAELLEATKALPRLSGAFSKAALGRNMEEISARNVRIMATVMTTFAAIIAVGVVYNQARIALAERGWELASLRVLGFTRAEVSALLLGELALAIAVALPLGMLLGRGLVEGIAAMLASDQFEFPVVIRPRTYAMAALAVLAAGVASAAVVRRRVDRLDLVGVLKTRE